jgi:3-methylfumaryl-CoA hydratase
MIGSMIFSDTTPAARVGSSQLAHLQQWVGKTESQQDNVAVTPVRALISTLDRGDPSPGAGSLLPPVPLLRRIWAGGRLYWEAENPLRVGDRLQRESRIESVTHKAGRTGDLVFVVVRHEIYNDGGLEDQDIVYRTSPQPDDPLPEPVIAAQNAAWAREIVPDPVLLFRYSALTFNGHRIHYDRGYATGVEGYPGLVVQGPLIATLLLDLLRRKRPNAAITKFQFKAMRPTFDLHTFSVKGRPNAANAVSAAGMAADKTVDLWAQDHEGLLTTRAQATLV